MIVRRSTMLQKRVSFVILHYTSSRSTPSQSFQALVCILIPPAGYLDSSSFNSRPSPLSYHPRTTALYAMQASWSPLDTTRPNSSLFRYYCRLAMPRKRPPPLEQVYCLLRRATLFFFFAVDACSGGGETDRDGE